MYQELLRIIKEEKSNERIDNTNKTMSSQAENEDGLCGKEKKLWIRHFVIKYVPLLYFNLVSN